MRAIHERYLKTYNHLMGSGLQRSLVGDGLLIDHREVEPPEGIDPDYAKVIAPDLVPFISYPYEWCFSQLKEAALATLKIHERALDYEMVLKDASAYNIQFHKGKALLIDTLSFEMLSPGQPWIAYRQFCQHFLAPLALMARREFRLSLLLRHYQDGIPLDLASRLLPRRTLLHPGLLMHIHMHARMQKRHGSSSLSNRRASFSLKAMRGLTDSLRGTIRRLKWKIPRAEWVSYYDTLSYTKEAFEEKKKIVNRWIEKTEPGNLWDLGANLGEFSMLAEKHAVSTVAFDRDAATVEKLYLRLREKGSQILPLVMDMTNPSSSQGWNHKERDSLASRGPADLVLALALIHHLAIGNNVPFEQIAEHFRVLGRNLVLEFVPRDDPMVQQMLSSREDIFSAYTEEDLLRAFSSRFEVKERMELEGSSRILYLMSAA